ncbi:MAG: YebC/PmpR family DNA-binding transcriptional regulator, partial [Spirochaeta sp.]|nr:YebC/PmpR family DNA-binding transcriptional regulator [Spirochaeta sp.]
SRGGGNLGESGCVSYLFKRKGIIAYNASEYSEDDIFAAALEAGADDVTNDSENIEVVTAPEDFESVLEILKAKNFEHSNAEIVMVADSSLTLDHDSTRKTLTMIENLEDHDDIQSVATNLEIPDGFEFDE